MTANEKRAAIAGISWWHSIDLGDGVVTPGVIKPDVHQKIAGLIPADLAGKSVLDIGCWDGWYSFECERRGATDVLGIDIRPACAGFDAAAMALGARSVFMSMDLFDLPLNGAGPWDVVLFLGVLYHLRSPLLGLENAAEACWETLVVESHFQKTSDPWPSMRFLPGAELNNDGSNWWVPSVPCLEAMVADVGFKIEETATYQETEVDGRIILRARRA